MPVQKEPLDQKYSKIYLVFDFIGKMLLLNLFFVVFSVIGLFIFGIGPSLCACHLIAKDWQNKDHPPMFRTMLQYFKKHFISSNLVFYGFAVVLVAIGFNFSYFYLNFEQSFYRSLGLITNIVLFIYVWVAFMTIYRIKYDFDASWKESIKYSFTVVWGFSKYLSLMIMVHAILLALTYIMPQIFSFIIVGAYILMVDVVIKKMKIKMYGINDEMEEQ
ncbi:YesL family protein [Peloplasma aerotolerans]|uniref:DUF624 domain-containing protein n=1 Tax=Peloplasma aerotolerans TaxID=3044389 RepID=A0AAW6U693_9MOLU|nr:DUF624 domain-containing protein [Mariniplasma sp. M4Ah]MDI6452425.1 DUF624 domain-containing protein [Mariniplasma sp. M4Ah]